MPNYSAIFEAVESTLIHMGSRNLPEDVIRSRLDGFKRVEGRRLAIQPYGYQTKSGKGDFHRCQRTPKEDL